MKKPDPAVSLQQSEQHHKERINNIRTKLGVRNGHRHLHLVPKAAEPVSTTPPPPSRKRLWWRRVLELLGF